MSLNPIIPGESSTESEIMAESAGGAHMYSRDHGAGAKAAVKINGGTIGDGYAYLKSNGDAKFLAAANGDASLFNPSTAQVMVSNAGGIYLRTKDYGTNARGEVRLEGGSGSLAGSAILKSSSNAKFDAQTDGDAIMTSSASGAEMKVASTGISTLKGSGTGVAIVTADSSGNASLANNTTATVAVYASGNAEVKSSGGSGAAKVTVEAGGDVVITLGN